MPVPVNPLRPYQNWGGENWRAEWNGEANLLKALGVMKAAIQDTMEVGVALAKAGHPEYPPPSEPYARFAERTRQTTEATRILEDAQIDWGPEPTHVWGRWGVEAVPAFQDPDEWREQAGFTRPAEGEMQDVTMENRAMFLEFGTGTLTAGLSSMAPRPFLYPAWDESKMMLPTFVMLYRGLMAGAVPFRG